MASSVKSAVKAWWGRTMVKRFYKAYSWLASVGAMVLSYGPDVANFGVSYFDLLNQAFPVFDDSTKLIILLVGHGIVFFVRPVKQPESMPQGPQG